MNIHPREMQTYVHVRTCTQVFTVDLVTARKWKHHKCPSLGENKLQYLCPQEYYSAVKGKKLLLHSNLDGAVLGGKSQSRKAADGVVLLT